MSTNDTRGRVDVRHVVQEYYDALDAGDTESVLALFSGDVLYRRPGYDRMMGLEALRRYYAKDRKLAPGRHVVRSLVVDGAQVAAHGEWEGELREGGRRSVGFAAFFVFDATGRISEHTTYFFVPAV